MRNLGLDLLRFVAVLLVVGRHLAEGIDEPSLIALWRRGGWVGVDLFFVLSGFLVSGLLFKEHAATGGVRAGRFLVRRAFRIYPAFWVFVLYGLLNGARHGIEIPPVRLLSELLFVQNYVPGLFGHTWSLAVEEHFYLGIAVLFPLLLRSRWRQDLSVIPFIYVASAALCLGLRIWTSVRVTEYSHLTHLFPTHLRLDSLMLGVAIAWGFHRGGLKERLAGVPSWALVLFGLLGLSPAFVWVLETTPLLSTVGLWWISLGGASLMLAAIRIETSESGLLRAVGKLGAASYSVYLWHLAVEAAIMGWVVELSRSYELPDPFGLYVVAYVPAVFLVGWALGAVVEWPTMRLRDRLFPSRAQSRR